MKPTFADNVRNFVGMSTDGLPDDGVTGDTAYTIDNQKEYINNDGHWYLKTNGYSSECKLYAFKMTVGGVEYTGAIDGLAVSVTVPYGSDVTAVAPTVTISTGATISPTTAQDFSSPVTYTVTAKDTINTASYVVTVTVEPEE